jgi:Holliday junction resolvasome RuvABC DNA-binding subunit
VIIGEAMNTAGSEYYNRVKAETAVRHLIRALMGLGYAEPQAVEAAESILERAGHDGLKTELLWHALDRVAPIPKTE